MKIHPRIRKEVHVLFWPWCAVMLTLAMWLTWHAQDTTQYWNDGLGSASLILSLGGALLAALSFGVEFHARTFLMLLSQPSSRRRLWGEKMLVLAALSIPALQLVGLLDFAYDPFSKFDRMGGVFEYPVLYMFVPLVCSAGFWSLVARSVIGGFVFSIAALGAVMLTVVFVVGEIGKGHPAQVNEWIPVAMSVAGLGYALLFLWLGWRKFAGLELNAAEAGEGGWGNSSESKAPIASLLRSRGGSPVANSVRKELRLLRPLLTLALLFFLFWLALTALAVLLPRQKDGAEILLATGTCIYMTFGLILAGCLPLCEERALGLHQTNLILPLAVRIQWRVKLLVSLLAGLLACVVLPVVLSILTAPAIASPLAGCIKSGEYVCLGIAALSLLLLLSFWSATMIGRLTQAVLLTIFAAALFAVAGWLGIRAAGGSMGINLNHGGITVTAISYFTTGDGGYYHKIYDLNPPEYFTQLTAWIAAHWQLSGAEFGRLDYDNWDSYGPPLSFWPAVILMAFAVGMQSWRAFRMPPAKWMWPLVRLVALIAVLGGLQISFLRTVDTMGRCMHYTPLIIETQAAFNALKPPPLPATGHSINTKVSQAEFQATGKLSAQTKFWLRNTTLQLHVERWKLDEDELKAYGQRSPIDPAATDRVKNFGVLIFPNGEWEILYLRDEFVPP